MTNRMFFFCCPLNWFRYAYDTFASSFQSQILAKWNGLYANVCANTFEQHQQRTPTIPTTTAKKRIELINLRTKVNEWWYKHVADVVPPTMTTLYTVKENSTDRRTNCLVIFLHKTHNSTLVSTEFRIVEYQSYANQMQMHLYILFKAFHKHKRTAIPWPQHRTAVFFSLVFR